MKRFSLVSTSLSLGLAGVLWVGSSAAAAPTPTVQQMLDLKPTQRFVEYDTPPADRLTNLKTDVVAEGRAKGWVLRETNGRAFRRFMDSNRDNVVDQWIYYRDGVEVYRDVDSNFNGRADQFRWVNAGGTRWGFDSNEDGRIDGYRVLSAEEATREFVRAIVQRDFSIIEPTLVKSADARELAGVVANDRIKQLNSTARDQFAALTQRLTQLSADSQWVRFEGGVPLAIPGEAADGSRDIHVYRNALVVIQTGNEIDVIQFGELVLAGQAWKITVMPSVAAANSTVAVRSNATFANVAPTIEPVEPEAPVPSELQTLIANLQKLDEEAAKTNSVTSARYQLQRADVLEKLAEQSKTPQDRAEWQRQLTDSFVAALQVEASPDAANRLTRLLESVRAGQDDSGLAAYIAFRRLSADYTRKMQSPSAEFDAVQREWLEQLDKFVTDFPKAEDAPEALSQLGIGMEFSGKDDQARKYYQTLAESFPKSTAAPRATGAIRRLDIVGKPLQLKAAELRRGSIDVQKLQGRVVLVDFWATNCDPWKNDLPRLKEIYARYHDKGFEIVGVSLDGDKAEVAKFVQSNKISWPVAFETGGLDSSVAQEFGIIALPTQFLVGADGKVISRSVHPSQLEEELRKLLK